MAEKPNPQNTFDKARAPRNDEEPPGPIVPPDPNDPPPPPPRPRPKPNPPEGSQIVYRETYMDGAVQKTRDHGPMPLEDWPAYEKEHGL